MKTTFAVAAGLLVALASAGAGQLNLKDLVLPGETEIIPGPLSATAPFVSPVGPLTNNTVYMGLVTNYNALGKWYGQLKAERGTLFNLAREKEKAKQTYAPEISKINTINRQIRTRLPQILDLQRRIRVMDAEQKARDAKAGVLPAQRK